MSEEKRDLKNQDHVSSSMGEAQGQPQEATAWKKFIAKKWAFPAMYLSAAAIILTLMWVYQDANTSNLPNETVSQGPSVVESVTGPDALPTGAVQETMQWPFKDEDSLEVVLPFFDKNASNEVRQAAMVEYGDTFTPHVGMDFARNDNEPFDVLAAMSGKVTTVERNHPIVGNLVEITHSNGLVSVYQSLSDIQVVKDQEVSKGDMIAKAGRNELEKEQGVHLHFELRQGQGGVAVNPETYIGE